MPYYTFRCEECDIIFERYLSFQDTLEDVKCPRGHGRVVRLYRPPAIVFKGSGFYVTDHRRSQPSKEKKSISSSKEAVKSETKAKTTPQE